MPRGGWTGGRKRGLNIPGAEDEQKLELDNKPSELFPPCEILHAAPPTEKELREIGYYKDLRDQIHAGPLYTRARTRDKSRPSKTYGEDGFNDQYGRNLKADFDPFYGVPTYSMKYNQKRRIIPQLSGCSFNKKLFPRELWPTLEGEESDAVRHSLNKSIKKKAIILSNPNNLENLTPEQRKQLVDEKLRRVMEEDEADVDCEHDDEEDVEEEQDYDYEDDEAEMGGDYGAEQYFDGGDGDDDDGVDGGGEDY